MKPSIRVIWKEAQLFLNGMAHSTLRRMVHDTDIVELELRSKRFSLAVRKKEAIEAMEPQVVYQVRLHPHIALHILQMTWALIVNALWSAASLLDSASLSDILPHSTRSVVHAVSPSMPAITAACCGTAPTALTCARVFLMGSPSWLHAGRKIATVRHAATQQGGQR